MISIRSYRPEEAHALLEMSISAFTTFTVFGPPWSSDAPALQTMLMARQHWEPELSRLAVDTDTGLLVGHAMWNPFRIRMGDERIPAICLAPLSVRDGWQNQGVGGDLVRDGLERARERGYRIAFVLGHEQYYPRFGFQTGVFGRSCIATASPRPLDGLPEGWTFRPLKSTDEAPLRRLWEITRGKEHGVLEPDDGLQMWHSRVKGIVACVLADPSGEPRAYARADLRPGSIPEESLRLLVADSADSAGMLLGSLARMGEWGNRPAGRFLVPMSPENPLAPAWFPGFEAVREPWEAAMAMPLDDSPETAALLDRVRRGTAPLWCIEWPPVFDE